MGNTINIASTILLGFGTIISIPTKYEDYQTPEYTINNFMTNDLSNPSFETANNEIFQISVLNTDDKNIYNYNELDSFVHSIVDNAKSLDSDISNFVSEHFWDFL